MEIPLYVDGVQKRGVLKSCDNPSRLGKGCISGSVLQRYEGRTRDGEPLPSVVWVSFGRNSSFAYRGKVHVLGSVQMIGYDEWTGATVFFESSDRIDPWADVDPQTYRLTGEMPWIDDRQAFNQAFRTPRKGQCVECHQNDPFIHNSFIDAATMPGTDDPVVPRIRTRDRDMRTDLPYHVLGGENWDMRTIHIEGNGCLDCHRIGMGTAMLFMRYGWHPNEHMPPKNPGQPVQRLGGTPGMLGEPPRKHTRMRLGCASYRGRAGSGGKHRLSAQGGIQPARPRGAQLSGNRYGRGWIQGEVQAGLLRRQTTRR